MSSPIARVSVLVLLLSALGGCRSAGTSFLILGGSRAPQQGLVTRVHGAELECKEAKDDFHTAFQLYQRLTSPQAVELETLSEDFGDAIESCQGRAKELVKRIDGVRNESQDLVKSWNEELGRFSGETLRKKSEAMLQDTEARSQRVLAALERVHGRMQPVLLKLQDYALFFHHNLNARAIATLQDTYKDFDAEFRALESEFGKLQTELTSFIGTFTEPLPTETSAPAPAE